MTTVALLHCTRYDDALLRRTIVDGLDMAGFDRGCLKHARVALKPNLLMAAAITLMRIPEVSRGVLAIYWLLAILYVGRQSAELRVVEFNRLPRNRGGAEFPLHGETHIRDVGRAASADHRRGKPAVRSWNIEQ